MGLWRRYLDWRRRHVAALALTSGGFRLSHGADSRDIAWGDVRRITAFKRDLLGYDCICLLMLLAGDIVELDEQMAGFSALREAMEQHFGLSPLWFIEIMTPAFETTPRDLYRHPDLAEPVV